MLKVQIYRGRRFIMWREMWTKSYTSRTNCQNEFKISTPKVNVSENGSYWAFEFLGMREKFNVGQ
jgi:hypothetical protein